MNLLSLPAAIATTKAKLIAAVVVLLAVSIALPYGMARTYRAGFEAGRADAVAMIAAARTQAAEDLATAHRKLLEVEQGMRDLEQEYAARLEQARAQREIQVRTVERVIRENPDFAATVRPVELDRVRDQQLADIAAAAAAGSTAAAELSDSGIPAVPAASDRDRRHARPDGDG